MDYPTSTRRFGPSERHLVFAGGGHAHLYSLLRTADFASRGIRVTLVNPARHLFYSGMAPGVVSGMFSPDTARIDVRNLVERGGGTFIEDRVLDISPDENLLNLQSGRSIRYDALSICLGSTVSPGFPTHDDDVLPVKPVENLMSLRRILLSRPDSRIVVAGAGPAGCEVACNARSLAPEAPITVLDRHPTLLPEATPAVQRKMLSHFERSGILFVPDAEVSRASGGIVRTSGDLTFEYDMLIVAVGTNPPSILERSGLLTSDEGSLWVNHYLQSPSHDNVFGGGDSISFRGNSLPHLGVFAIRQGPVLFGNLKAYLSDRPLIPFTPRKRYLYILNLGDGSGIASRGRVTLEGRLAWLLKRRIDERFVARFGSREDGA